MSRRRPVAWLGALAFAAAAVLLFAWKLREEPGTRVEPLLDPDAVALESSPSTPAATPAPADAAPAGEPARADAPTELLDPGADEVDEFTTSGLREARAPEREVTRVIGRVVDSEGEPVAGARVLVSCALTLVSA